MISPALEEKLLALIERLEPLLPPEAETVDWSNTLAARWHGALGLRGIAQPNLAEPSQLVGIERQKKAFFANTQQFLKDWPFNHVLLWGARGTGKSTLARGLLTHFRGSSLRLIQIDKSDLGDLPRVIDSIANQPFHFVVYCDDLSFEAGDNAYQSLKSVLDGALDGNTRCMVVATSNRRHLVPESMADNLGAEVVGGELQASDATEEKVSLSDRFGLSLSFYAYPKAEYLAICRGAYQRWAERLPVDLPAFDASLEVEAMRFATARGGRGGRVAEQFVNQWLANYLSD